MEGVTTMKIEHRHMERYEVDIPITIAYPPLGLVQARVTNISRDGMHIDTGPIRLRVGYGIEAFVTTSSNHLQTLKALVMQTSHRGSGLFFVDELDKQEITLLLQAHKRAA
jgi:hypothetical protein